MQYSSHYYTHYLFMFIKVMYVPVITVLSYVYYNTVRFIHKFETIYASVPLTYTFPCCCRYITFLLLGKVTLKV